MSGTEMICVRFVCSVPIGDNARMLSLSPSKILEFKDHEFWNGLIHCSTAKSVFIRQTFDHFIDWIHGFDIPDTGLTNLSTLICQFQLISQPMYITKKHHTRNPIYP